MVYATYKNGEMGDGFWLFYQHYAPIELVNHVNPWIFMLKNWACEQCWFKKPTKRIVDQLVIDSFQIPGKWWWIRIPTYICIYVYKYTCYIIILPKIPNTIPYSIPFHTYIYICIYIHIYTMLYPGFVIVAKHFQMYTYIYIYDMISYIYTVYIYDIYIYNIIYI